MPATPGAQPAAIFRLYSADDTYLYGGVTSNPKRSVAGHLRKERWWPSVTRRELIWFESRAEAAEAEAAFGDRGIMARGHRPSARFPHHPRCAHKAYHMSCEQYEHLLSQAGYRCGACGHDPQADVGLALDHDHSLGFRAVRGLACPSCNALIHNVEVGKRQPTKQLAHFLANPWHAAAGITDYSCPANCRHSSHVGATKWARGRG